MVNLPHAFVRSFPRAQRVSYIDLASANECQKVLLQLICMNVA
jgi:hypothetical protein